MQPESIVARKPTSGQLGSERKSPRTRAAPLACCGAAPDAFPFRIPQLASLKQNFSQRCHSNLLRRTALHKGFHQMKPARKIFVIIC
jgi:hypothetical protein